jgi:hypothetical protein
MDRAAIVACPIMVVGVVMLCGTAQPSIQRNARRFVLAPPGEVDRVRRCRLWVKSRHLGERATDVRFTPKSGHSAHLKIKLLVGPETTVTFAACPLASLQRTCSPVLRL